MKKFTTSCYYIGKGSNIENAKIRLKANGYKTAISTDIKTLNDNDYYLIETIAGENTAIIIYIYDFIEESEFRKYNCSKSLDLFISVACINDIDDKNQYFKVIGKGIFKSENHAFIPPCGIKIKGLTYRKLNITELIIYLVNEYQKF